jgi:hypothetical protein
LRALLFDIGASKWASSSANGVRWLTQQHKKVGVLFEHVYAWEAKEMQAGEFLRGLQLQM